jgi:hypothetical protein
MNLVDSIKVKYNGIAYAINVDTEEEVSPETQAAIREVVNHTIDSLNNIINAPTAEAQ